MGINEITAYVIKMPTCPTTIFISFNVRHQVIGQVFCNDVDKDIKANLWEREKYWQSQLFTNVYGMNSVSDLYSRKRKDFRRK